MKKFVSLLLALLMIASLAACGKKANDDKTTDDSLSVLENVVTWNDVEPYRVLVQKGDPKGLLPGINAAIAKLNSENKLQSFIDAANELATKAVEAN